MEQRVTLLVKPKDLSSSGDDFGTQILRWFGVGPTVWGFSGVERSYQASSAREGVRMGVWWVWMLLKGGRFSASKTFEKSGVS